MFRIRIDLVEGVATDDIIQFLKNTKSNVIVKHELPNGNPHIHAYIDCDMKEPAVRQRIKRKFNMLRPSDFSLKKCDQDRINEYIQYMFNTKHGNKWELISTYNFDNKLLNDLKENAEKISTDYAARKSKKSHKPTIWELAEEINTKHNLFRRDINYEEHFKEALQHAVDVCVKYKQPFEFHYLKRLATTALSINPTTKYAVISHIMQKEFSSYKV